MAIQNDKVRPPAKLQHAPLTLSHHYRNILRHAPHRLCQSTPRHLHHVPHAFVECATAPNQRVRPVNHHAIPNLPLLMWYLSVPGIYAVRQTGQFDAIGDEDAF